MQLAPLSTSLNTQISVNIYTHVRTHTDTYTDKRRCNFRCHSSARFTAYATNHPPSRLLPLSRTSNNSFNFKQSSYFNSLRLRGQHLGDMHSNNNSNTNNGNTMPGRATPLDAWGASALGASACAFCLTLSRTGVWWAHECGLCVCVRVCICMCLYYTHPRTQTHACTAHTHDYQNVRHLSFNLIWLHLLSFVRLRLCLRHFLCISLRFSTLSLPFLVVCVSCCCCFFVPFLCVRFHAKASTPASKRAI